jgi:hypothetical protein
MNAEKLVQMGGDNMLAILKMLRQRDLMVKSLKTKTPNIRGVTSLEGKVSSTD